MQHDLQVRERLKNIERVLDYVSRDQCRNKTTKYAQLKNETTSAWLESLIAVGAPADVRANVQAILVTETYHALNKQAGNLLIPLIIYVYMYYEREKEDN